MLTRLIVATVAFCCRFAWLIVTAFLALAGVSAHYATTQFALSTDSSQLISTRLPWRQRELAIDKAFPQRTDLIVVVVDATTPERADAAADALATALQRRPEYFQFVRRPEASPILQQSGLLFLSEPCVAWRTRSPSSPRA